jgi:hypothetical protein
MKITDVIWDNDLPFVADLTASDLHYGETFLARFAALLARIDDQIIAARRQEPEG